MKKFEGVELSQGNASGKAGVGSIPFGRGYFQSGNNGEMGIGFTPSSEPTIKTFKNIRHSRKNMKKRNKMKKFKDFVKENYKS